MQLRTRGLVGDSLKLPEGSEYYASQAEMSPETRRQMEEYAYRYGRSYDSYLITEPDREYFWCRERRGILGFVTRLQRYVHVVGGLIAAEADRAVLLADFMEFVNANRLVLCFYNVAAGDIDLFRKYPCQITKVGEEPIVDLTETRWNGGAYAWVRRQENYCLRRGAELREVVPDLDDSEYCERIAPELEEVSSEGEGCSQQSSAPASRPSWCAIPVATATCGPSRRSGGARTLFAESFPSPCSGSCAGWPTKGFRRFRCRLYRASVATRPCPVTADSFAGESASGGGG
jgi:hypothetical protein